MGIRFPLKTVLTYNDAGQTGATSVAGGVAKTFTIPQDADGVVVNGPCPVEHQRFLLANYQNMASAVTLARDTVASRRRHPSGIIEGFDGRGRNNELGLILEHSQPSHLLRLLKRSVDKASVSHQSI